MPLATVALLLVLDASASLTSAQWIPLIRDGKFEDARTLCGAALSATSAKAQAEGHKCLANVELGTGDSGVRVEGNEGGGLLTDGYSVPTARKAIEHLNVALQLAPQDLSIHQGRLHILEAAGLFDEMAPALEESIRLYPNRDGIEAWLDYSQELFEMGKYSANIGLLKVLHAHYPKDHRVAGNFAGTYGAQENFEEALAWSQKAVAMSPKDPIDNLNLARTLANLGRLDEADAAYQKSLKLRMGDDLRHEAACVYADFVEQQRKDRLRACALQKTHHCDASACGPKE